jgi:CRP/FNR family transcriptional regulator
MNSTPLVELYPVLAELPSALQARIAASLQTLSLTPGTVVFDERQPCAGFPFILDGAIRVAKVSSGGRELPLYRVVAGESCIITSSCLLGHADYNARGVTEGATTLALLPRALFDEVLAEPAFRDFVFALFSERMAELMQLVEEVAFRKLDQRLAALLLGKGRVLKTTHQQLADELGSVREMVSRLLKGFAEQGLVQARPRAGGSARPGGLAPGRLCDLGYSQAGGAMVKCLHCCSTPQGVHHETERWRHRPRNSHTCRRRTGRLGRHGRPGLGLDRRCAPGYRRDRLVPALRDLRLQHLLDEEAAGLSSDGPSCARRHVGGRSL